VPPPDTVPESIFHKIRAWFSGWLLPSVNPAVLMVI
jgi:hypothetical protein